MTKKFLRLLGILGTLNLIHCNVNNFSILLDKNFSRLIDFTCATAKDELEKHPEMRTIAMVELENNFPTEFSREVLKCLPEDVAKVIINPHDTYGWNNTFWLSRSSLAICIADRTEKYMKFYDQYTKLFWNYAVIDHLSKHLIVSSRKVRLGRIFGKLRNIVQINEENQKVIARGFDMTRNLITSETFESSQRKNLSQILFPDKTKNLNGQTIIAIHKNTTLKYTVNGKERLLIYKWTFYLEIVAEKLNATLELEPLEWGRNRDQWDFPWLLHIHNIIKFDFMLERQANKQTDLYSYNFIEWCFAVGLPDPIPITDQILFLPMDKSCWMWLGITIAVSTFVWRISEGHWSFPFGFFAYFMGQAQLIIRIRTNRLTMKILLQLLIFTIFIFSNGYQSIVTSFMLEPMQEKLLQTVDEVLVQKFHITDDSDLPKHEKYLAYIEGKGTTILDWGFVQTGLCNERKFDIQYDGNGKSFHGMYVVPEVLLKEQHDFYVHPYHPYLDKFQELMDRTFEAGLHQAWEKFYYQDWRDHFEHEPKKPEEPKEILDFELIAPSLFILAFGLPAALLALLFEIFSQDFVMKLSKDYLTRKWNETCGRRLIRFQVKRPKVKFIQVRPVKSRRNTI